MSKFKVGDVVVGNANANVYSVTCEGWLGTVINCYDDSMVAKPSIPMISVQPLTGFGRYTVDPKFFDLVSKPVKENNVSMTKQALLDKLSRQDDCYYSVAQVIYMIKNIEEPKNDSSLVEVTEEMYDNFLNEARCRFEASVIDTAMECLENVVNKYVVVLEKD